jgi:hypothetical protein
MISTGLPRRDDTALISRFWSRLITARIDFRFMLNDYENFFLDVLCYFCEFAFHASEGSETSWREGGTSNTLIYFLMEMRDCIVLIKKKNWRRKRS